jgi:hypothetical protein
MTTEADRDVMQVCGSGHVITDLLSSHPELARSHCDRCGAATFSRCPVCGRELPGAVPVPGLRPIGERRAPEHCPSCGAAFPWAERPAPPLVAEDLHRLMQMVRRLPLAARQLRDRHEGRSTLIVQDIFDLQDLLRCVLHLHFDNVRQQSRTPSYASHTRTDFEVGDVGRIALTVKLVTADVAEHQLMAQLEEDAAHYERQGRPPCLLCVLYDPGQLLPRPEQLEAAWQRRCGAVDVRCVVV